MQVKFRLALQKSGRLSEESVRLLKECGIDFQNSVGSKLLRAESQNFPMEFLFLRDDDIPGYVEDGVVDAGIVGLNVVRERGAKVDVVEELGFGACRLALAASKGSPYQSLQDLDGKRIATSYPRILRDYLAQKGMSAEIHEISGSVEIAPSIGLADAICDLVSTGSTLVANGLREIETVMQSQAVLAVRAGLPQEKLDLLQRLCFRIQAVRRASRTKYILLNAPTARLEQILAVLPACKSPTVLPLAIEGWSSVHSVVDEDCFWSIIENLKQAGAEGILVLPIEKMVL
ncbi:MAG: ATP phosphoribosyltransferase [Deltaproteobacteria bacterium]|nr:ATP phosphoribosyltransferase [Deltaproteobacteria bacterium]